jgi:hypothetical protein
MGPEKIKLIFIDLDALNRCLHEHEGGRVGSPIHIIVDDGHLQDSDVLYCTRYLDVGTTWSSVVRVVTVEMLRLLSLLTPPQRLMWYIARQLAEIGENPVEWASNLGDGVLEWRGNRDGDFEAVVTKSGSIEFPGLSMLRRRREAALLRQRQESTLQNILDPRETTTNPGGTKT